MINSDVLRGGFNENISNSNFAKTAFLLPKIYRKFFTDYFRESAFSTLSIFGMDLFLIE